MYVYYPYSSTDKTNLNKNQQEELGVIYLNTFNQLIITSEITQPSPSPLPSTNLQGYQSWI